MAEGRFVLVMDKDVLEFMRVLDLLYERKMAPEVMCLYAAYLIRKEGFKRID